MVAFQTMDEESLAEESLVEESLVEAEEEDQHIIAYEGELDVDYFSMQVRFQFLCVHVSSDELTL